MTNDLHNNNYIQGHPKSSSTLVPIESAYATSY